MNNEHLGVCRSDTPKHTYFKMCCIGKSYRRSLSGGALFVVSVRFVALCGLFARLRSSAAVCEDSATTDTPKNYKCFSVFGGGLAPLLALALAQNFRFVPLPAPSLFFCFFCPVLVCPLLRRFIQTAYALWSRSRWFTFFRVLSPCFCCCFSFVPFWFFPVLTGLVFFALLSFSSTRAPCSLSSLRPSSRVPCPRTPYRV